MAILNICFILLTALTTGSIDSITNAPMFELISLPYPTDALEPALSQEAIEIHHGKHLKGYVNNLNRLISATPYARMSLTQIVIAADSSIYDSAIFNNAGQLLNHNLYFTQFAPQGSNPPQGILADAIYSRWGSFDNFKREFSKSGSELFGSGWIWLATDHEGTLYIIQEANGGNPVTKGLTPLLGIDVWEHAYYIDYRNRRSDYINALWDIIDWQVVEQRYESSGVVENSCQQAIKALTQND